MSGSVQRGLCVLLCSAAAGFSVWKFGAGSPVDRGAFSVVARGFANPPLFVEGEGTHTRPWLLKTFALDAQADQDKSPLVVSLGDDVAGFFQSSPPGPIDHAVVLKNFHRLGATKVTLGVVLAWETPDAVEYVALERSLKAFDSLVMTAPLSRGAVATPLPQEFRRASLAIESVRGDVSAVPVVNRIPLPGVVLGGEKALAGFSVLESENPSRFLPLMARWEDRLVFSSALLAVIQRLDINLSDLEIRPGEFLRLGPGGPVVPLDRFGRLGIPLPPLPGYKEVPAEEVIDGEDGLFPAEAAMPVVFRDDRSATEPGTRNFNRSVPAAVAILSSLEGLAPSRSYPRLPVEWETGILGAAVVALALLGGAGASKRLVGTLALAGVFLAAQWIGFGMASVWLPGIPVLAAIVSAALIGLPVGKRKQSVPQPAPVIPQLADEPPAVAPAPVAPEPSVSGPATPETAADPPAPKPAGKPPQKKSSKPSSSRKKGKGPGR